MWRYLTVAYLVVLAGCMSPGVSAMLPKEAVDATYTEGTIRWAGTFGGLTSTYYVKTYELDGMMAVCGARVSERTGFFDDLADQWFVQAFVVVGSRDNKIVSASFMAEALPETPRSEIVANCVKSTVSATETLLNARAAVTGEGIEIQY